MHLSNGTKLIAIVALLTSICVALWPIPQRDGLAFWIFADVHSFMYEESVQLWNDKPEAKPVNLFTIGLQPLVRRTLSGFWAGTEVADLMEIERDAIGQFFTGPLEDVGFVDLTDRLHEEGIYEAMTPASFSPWTSRGRIFGLPHDVHPVMLAYRSDFVEEAGIDVNTIETWDDFTRVFGRLQKDLDGDGTIDRYALSIWYTTPFQLQALTLQAGGGTFDTDGNLIVDSEPNARVIARIVSWCIGPNRIAIDAPEFSASGNRLKIDGRVIAALMPDWLAGVWMKDLPQLHGKLKLMPLPAWKPGGRRTSVHGGTMLAITKQSKEQEAAWDFAKHLYLSEQLAERLFETNHIISPVIKLWDRPFYKRPISYFNNQQTGLMFIEMAPDVPLRPSSPYHTMAITEMSQAVNAVYRYARDNAVYNHHQLQPIARQELARAAARVEREMSRNLFITEAPESAQ